MDYKSVQVIGKFKFGLKPDNMWRSRRKMCISFPLDLEKYYTKVTKQIHIFNLNDSGGAIGGHINYIICMI